MRALSLHKFLDVKSLRLITSEGPCVFSKGKCGEGSRRGARPLLVGGVALLLLVHNLVLLVVPALSENLSLSEETPRQLFLTFFSSSSFCVSHKTESTVLKCCQTGKQE